MNSAYSRNYTLRVALPFLSHRVVKAYTRVGNALSSVAPETHDDDNHDDDDHDDDENDNDDTMTTTTTTTTTTMTTTTTTLRFVRDSPFTSSSSSVVADHDYVRCISST